MSYFFDQLLRYYFDNKETGDLPAGFRKCLWLSSNRFQYIDTGITPQQGDILELDYIAAATRRTDSQAVFSAGEVDPQFILLLGTTKGNKDYYKYFASGGAVSILNLPTDGTKITAGQELFYNSEKVAESTPVGEVDNTLLYFTRRGLDQPAIGVKIGANRIAGKFDFVPVIVDPGTAYIDGNTGEEMTTDKFKPGYYDKISKKLFTNQGTMELNCDLLPQLGIKNGYPGTTQTAFNNFVNSGFTTPFSSNASYRTIYTTLPPGRWRITCNDPNMKIIRSLVNNAWSVPSTKPAFDKIWTVTSESAAVIQAAYSPAESLNNKTLAFTIEKISDVTPAMMAAMPMMMTSMQADDEEAEETTDNDEEIL